MNLSHLIESLSPDERVDLFRRRQLEPMADLPSAALADVLLEPFSLARVFIELNAFQHLVLRWLARQPHLQASWSTLEQAIGVELHQDYLERQLQDLKLWGLVDSSRTVNRGYLATYPAIAASLPPRRRASLVELLQRITSDSLRRMLTELEIVRPPTTKDARMQLIISSLAQPKFCRAIVAALSDEARSLFAWVREHGGRVSLTQIHQHSPVPQRYGYGYASVEGYLSHGPQGATPLAMLVRRGLVVPWSAYHWASQATAFIVPEEVEQAMSGSSFFEADSLGLPPFPSVEPVNSRAPNPTHLLRDLGHLLGFVTTGRCEWRQDGQPNKRSLQTFGKLLGNPDSDYIQLLWDLTEGANLLRPPSRGQNGYQSAAVGSVEPSELFRRLLVAWEGRDPAAWTGLAISRVRDVRRRVVALLDSFPPDSWVSNQMVDRALAFVWPLVFSPEYRLDVDGNEQPDWSSLRYLLLATGQTADGQPAVMLPAELQALLPGPDGPGSDSLPAWEEHWIVQPDRTIVAPPNLQPDALVDLWKVAQLETNQGASVFRVSTDSIAAALNRGTQPATALQLLEARSRTPLPDTVKRIVADQGQRYGQIKVGAARTYVRTEDPAQLEELLKHRKLRDLTWRQLSPGVAFVENLGPNEVLASLRKAGYLPVADGTSDQTVSAAPAPSPKMAQAKADRKLVRVCKLAISDGLDLHVRWADGRRTRQATIEPYSIAGGQLYGIDISTEEELIIDLETIDRASARDPGDMAEVTW